MGISLRFFFKELSCELFWVFLSCVQVLRKLGYACLVIVASGFCFVVSGMGLAQGPLCLHNGTEGLKWERPLKQVNIGWVRLEITFFHYVYKELTYYYLFSRQNRKHWYSFVSSRNKSNVAHGIEIVDFNCCVSFDAIHVLV